MQGNICPVRKFLENKEGCRYIQQIQTGCLSQNAYYIQCKDEAIVIDPMRDVDNILNILKERNATLKYIFETHFHADFVSGHVELAKKTQAKIVYGPGAKTPYEIISANDGQIFEFGYNKIKVIHTPGHTMESVCFLLINSAGKEEALFTGDTVFLGEVGRPDLAVKGDLKETDLAAYLWDSIQKIKTYGDDLLIFPGHGAGSACGKNIQSGTGDTLANQKKKNYAFKDDLTKEEFVKIATSDLPTPPEYFFHDVKMNKEGYEYIDNLLKKSLKGLKYEEIQNLIKKENAVLIDTRNNEDIFNSGYVKGSLLISLKLPYAKWTATLIKPDQKIILIANKDNEKESMIRLYRVGYYNILGFVEEGIESYVKNNSELITKFRKLNYEETKKMLNEGSLDLIDIREEPELTSTGTLENSTNFPLSSLELNINKLKNQKKTYGIFCKSGARAVLACSVFEKNGVNDFYHIGGFEGLKENGFKCV